MRRVIGFELPMRDREQIDAKGASNSIDLSSNSP